MAASLAGRIRGLKAALNSSRKYIYKPAEISVDHLVIGGGVVGLAITRQLAQGFPTKNTYLVERRSQAGQETSSRNSEVIHSGLYYPPSSLKTKLCTRGRSLLYEYCRSSSVPHRKTGKLVVATALDQIPFLESLHSKSQQLDEQLPAESALSTKLISGDAARSMTGGGLGENVVKALWCPETGIIDSHTLMQSLEKDISDAAEDAHLLYSTRAVRIDWDETTSKWVVQLETEGQNETVAVSVDTLINAAGLSAPLILNATLPPSEHVPMYYARGSYASYTPHKASNRLDGTTVKHLIYPCPSTQGTGFESLGTHLTLDMEGKIRFGPDLEWLDPFATGDDANPDFWEGHLKPSSERLPEMHSAIKSYLPSVELEDLAPDYVGIRPKIVGPGGGFQDFVFRRADSEGGRKGNGMISLLGIESPGLTSSLAIAEVVVKMVMGNEGR